MPVYAVLADEQRDAQPSLRRELGRAQDALGRGVQDRAHVLAEHVVVEIVARVELQHLPDLLLERHACEEILDAFGNRECGVLIGQGRGRRLKGH